ncbi:uncharacterized protein TRUGW13939_08781 [Talaromyces rugulosus]|uniref:Uncharacterized protein n=1 Tax=Talaromyces rugulosus TaxID=121627 RepID=A0A7H8R5H5_TALRU|nr:uncharacterized protein TRUGW13939_08781 [Talaromyces rugulosus]QKX61629.1 hypothetical protein TRUGW13939_08781 [Talaromyces rugulosus]
MPDYSSWFRIHNRLNVPLIQKSEAVYSGYWERWPPQRIEGHSTSGWFQIKDKFGSFGSDGEVQYDANIDGQTYTIQFKAKCPSGDPNEAKIWNLSPGDNPPVVTVSSISPHGHPTEADFVVISLHYN